MSQDLRIDNFTPLNLLETTQIDADSLAAAVTLTVKNNEDYSNTDKVLLADPGSENCEVVIVSGTTGNTSLTVGATRFPHYRFDPVTKLFGNQLKIYTAPNVDGTAPADANFSLLGVPIDIDIDNRYTDYTDSSGSSSVWYKYTYYNSVSLAETSIANSTAVRGGDAGNYCSIESVRDEAGFTNNKYISDSQVDEKRQAAQAEVNGALSGLYSVPFEAPINPFIAEITRNLAAGMLLTKDYGTINAFSTNEGSNKVKWAREQLEKIKNKAIILTGILGDDTSVSGAGGWSSWPDSTTADADSSVGGGARMIRVSDRY